MKKLQAMIISGLLIPFLPLCSEEAATPPQTVTVTSTADVAPAPAVVAVETRPPAAVVSYVQEEDAAPVSELNEELSRLDDEFNEFKEELFSLEDQMQQQAEEVGSDTIVDTLLNTPNFPEEINTFGQIVIDEDTNLEDEDFVSKSQAVAEPDPLTEEMFVAPESAKLTVMPKEQVALLDIEEKVKTSEQKPVIVDLKQAFSGSPIIYLLLLGMSIFCVCVYLFSSIALRSSAKVPNTMLKSVQTKLGSNNFEDALALCENTNSLFCKMVASGIHSRRHGLPIMVEAMKSEGKRTSVGFWHKIGLLNDVAIIAPMLGLLGTVLGMFYAFYDVNRSMESIATLFDGLGVSVGTTVAGLVVAIFALILHSMAKYQLVRALSNVENEAQNIATLIEDRTSIYKG